jgi:hypothetical protein
MVLKKTSGLKKLTFGIMLIFIGVSLIFVKDFADGILKTIFFRAGYLVFISGFILGALGIGQHWISFFSDKK